MFSSNRNVVDDSVRNIIECVPNIVRNVTALYIKYGKLIGQKYNELMASDEKRRIKGVKSIDSLLSLTFDKLLFALDKDAYIDFINEINSINSDYIFLENIHYGMDVMDDEKKLPYITSINLAFLSNPVVPLNRLSQFNYEILNSVPLIKIIPLPCIQTNTKKFREESPGYSFISFTNEDESNYGIGLNINECGIKIDLCALLENIRSRVLYSSGYDDLYKEFEFFKSESEENAFIETNSKILSDRIVYSMTTTYLAYVTRVTESAIKPLDIIFADILNSCRKTVLNNYDSLGNDIKTGMGLRHMAIDISSLLNAIAYTDNSHNESTVLRQMIETIIAYLFTTYNYRMIPFDNLKHKHLVNIGKIAKSQIFRLKPDTRAAIQSCVAMKEHDKSIDANNYFCSTTFAKINGTYAFNKRLFDTGKDFIDVFAKFIVIKKRMYSAGGLNFSDGTIDNIGKRYVDYKTYLKNTYEELKTSLTNIYTRIKAITIGKRYLTPGNIAVKNSDSDVIRNLNTIVFGINSESVLDESYETEQLYVKNPFVNDVDRGSKESTYYTSVNRKIQDIRSIYNILKDRECNYANNNSNLFEALNIAGNGSLITLWIAVNSATNGYSMLERPYEFLSRNSIEMTLNYGDTSISEMAPKGELINEGLREEFRDWSSNSNTQFRSLEELKNDFENLKEKVEKSEDGSETIFGGLLFGDFGGIPLAHDMTAKETELYNDQLSVKTVNPDEVESFEDLKREFDEFLAKHI